MRGDDRQQGAMFSYVSLEQRVPENHPLRLIRTMVDQALVELSAAFEGVYSRVGRPSIPPEKLLIREKNCGNQQGDGKPSHSLHTSCNGAVSCGGQYYWRNYSRRRAWI
jgi:hypothetical protein